MIARALRTLRRGWAPLWVGLAGLLLAAVFALLDASIFGLELRTLDLRFQLRGPLPLDHSPVVIVEVDNRTYKDLDARWPFSRGWHARLLRNLRAAGARAVVFDIMFTESAAGDPEGDRELAAALAEKDDTILSGEVITEGDRAGSSYTRIDPPLPALLANGTPWGLVDDIKDRDRINRRYNLYQPHNGVLLPTIGTRLMMKLEGVDSLAEPEGRELVIGSCRIPLVRGLKNIMRINYYGPSGSFPRYSFSSILDDADFDLADPEMDSDYMELMKDPELFAAFFGEGEEHPFKDRIVLVGVSADDLHDNKMTPWYGYGDSAMETPGVETHAHAIQTMLDRSFITRTGVYTDRWLAVAAALAGGLAVVWLGPALSLGLLALLAAGWAWACLAAFTDHNLWLPLLVPPVAMAGAWTAGVLQQFLRARRERQEVRAIFSKYVSKAVVNEVLKDPTRLALGGEVREISALFSDIAGFTTISESLNPADLQQLLNEYLSEMTDLVFEHQGILDKYIGDAIVAEFGAPLPHKDHPLQAISAAVAMTERLAQLRPAWIERGFPPVHARIGINSGPMAVGNFGSREIHSYTAIGDNMNLAARLEGANKFYGSTIMTTAATWNRLEGAFVGRCLDVIRVKGKEEGVEVHEVLCRTDSPAAARWLPRVQAWNEARALMVDRHFGEARLAFEALLERWPDDGPARVMQGRCAAFEHEPPAPDWDGVTAFEEK